MKQSKTTMKELTRRYRAVLIKCALLNLAAFSVALPANAADRIVNNGTYSNTNSQDLIHVENSADNIIINGGTFNADQRGAFIASNGSGDIIVTRGTFNNNTQREANDIVHFGSGDIKISGGVFNKSGIGNFLTCSNGYGSDCHGASQLATPTGKIEISGGTFTDAEIISNSLAGITVSGGTFNDGPLMAENGGTLTITGGSFRDNYLSGENVNISGGVFSHWAEIDPVGGDLNITGGDFSKLTYLEMYGENITIDSDKANFALSADKMANGIETGKLTVTGDKGVSVAKTIVSAPEISGKITAGNSAFIGGFGNSMDNWKGNYRVSQDAFGIDTKLNNADITLNADAKVGTGDIIRDINSLRGGGSIPTRT